MTILQPLTQPDLDRRFTAKAHELILGELAASSAGQCLRISTLPRRIACDLCATLNAQALDADIALLLGPWEHRQAPWEVTATRLIELRNAATRPLLVFVPPGLKAAAEDSFDVSTFREIVLQHLPRQLLSELRSEVPDGVVALMDRTVRFLRSRSLTDDDLVRYYLSVLNNGAGLEAAGGAVYQLGLIPDFALFSDPRRVEQRLDQNTNAVTKLIDATSPLLVRIVSLGLEDAALQSTLHGFLQQQATHDVPQWAEQIACTPDCRCLAFENWIFADEFAGPERPIITLHDLRLTARDPSRPLGADNPLFLDVRKARTVQVKWETRPKPSLLPELAHFRIELVDADGAVTWQGKNIRNTTSKLSSRTRSVKVAEFRDLVEDGIHYFRVRAYTQNDEILNEENADEHPEILRDPQNPEGKRTNESDDVYLWIGGENEDSPVSPPRNVTVNSYLSAQLHAWYAAFDRGEDPLATELLPQAERSGWVTSKGKRAEAIYNVVFDSQARFTMPVNSVLRHIEDETLAHPENLGRWRLNLSQGQTYESAEPTPRPYRDGAQVPAKFRHARAALFRALRGPEGGELTATADLYALRHQILEYARAYGAWLAQADEQFDVYAIREEQGKRRTEALFLDLDAVEVLLPNGSGEPDRVYLLAPTHPLRLLWHLQRAQLGRSWLAAAYSAGEQGLVTRAVRRFLLQGLAPNNLPPVLRITHEGYPQAVSHYYVEQGALGLFWTLYVREDLRDGRSLRARLQRLLGIARLAADVDTYGGIRKETMSTKLQRYLFQHPYVRTLRINVFNPGDAGLIVDAILQIEKNRGEMPRLSYELRLFGGSSQLDDMGEAVEQLLNPERQVTAEANAFLVAAGNHLFPKLRYSRNRFEDYLRAPERYEAHISILHDLFPVSVEPAARLDRGRSSFLHGLLQEQVTQYAGDATFYAWCRQLLPKGGPELPDDAQHTAALMADLLRQTAELQAAVAIGKRERSAVPVVPTLQLALRSEERSFLYQVHTYSDWVFVVDRHLGLEYFDGETSDDRPVFLLDATPEFGAHDTERLLLTTRSTQEIVQLIRPALVEHQLLLDEGGEGYFLQLLRSLSGQLALKLLSAPNTVSEALGLALARLFLEQYALLQERIVLPLDAHLYLFSGPEPEITLAHEVTLSRSDLLLVSCLPDEREIRLHIIEVKWRDGLTPSAYTELCQDAEAQITQTEAALRRHFDPNLQPADRLDRHLKTKELISLLTFYLGRSERYGLVTPESAGRLHGFLVGLDQGYQLKCSGVGLVFDFSFQGMSVLEEHPDLVFYRIGGDYVQRLLNNGLRRRALLREEAGTKPTSINESERQTERKEQVLRDTDMHADPTFARIQTQFGRRNEQIGESPQPPVRPQDPQQTGAIGASDDQPHAESISLPRIEDDMAGSSTVPDVAPPGAVLASEVAASTGTAEQHADGTERLPPSDALLGETRLSGQFGVLGRASGRFIALDLNGTNTVSLFGVQGGGKSYTVGSIVEMATQSMPGINLLPSPLATVIFHYNESQDYPPEFVSMVQANDEPQQIRVLAEEYGAHPRCLSDVIILTSADKVAVRRAEFPGVRVEPIAFSSHELSFRDWRFLMGVAGNQMYMKQINLIMRQLGERITLEGLRSEIEESELSDNQKGIARLRLNFAEQFLDDSRRLAEAMRPGRLLIVDLRDEYIDKDEALGLFVVMLNIMANAGRQEGYNKLIVFDEAHKYMDNGDLTGHIVDVIRQMRHQGVTILIASQDPPSLPNEVIELSSLVILHRFNSPKWLKHVQRSITALADLTPEQMAALRPGEAYVWATKSTDRLFTQKAVKVHFRPRITRHGGGTKTAI